MGDQWLATPVLGDERKQTMLNLVPFACPRREVTNGDGKAQLVDENLQLSLPYEWSHLATAVRIRSEKRDLEGKLLSFEDRYYISSLQREKLTDEQWLRVVRLHWGVENNCHNTFDTVFEEDDHPWIEMDPQGTVVLMLLRRLAYNILALFRRATQRSEERRHTPWKDLVRWFYNAIITATNDDVAGLRRRKAAVSLA